MLSQSGDGGEGPGGRHRRASATGTGPVTGVSPGAGPARRWQAPFSRSPALPPVHTAEGQLKLALAGLGQDRLLVLAIRIAGHHRGNRVLVLRVLEVACVDL